jgi:hypothetical protein
VFPFVSNFETDDRNLRKLLRTHVIGGNPRQPISQFPKLNNNNSAGTRHCNYHPLEQPEATNDKEALEE